MIQQITSFTLDEIEILECSYRGMQILSYQKAYGGGYDFCRFFRLCYPEGRGWMLLFQSTLLVCTEAELPAEELRIFLSMHLPFRVECDAYLLPELGHLSCYQTLHRVTFGLVPSALSAQFQENDIDQHPKLDTVYSILQEGFPNLCAHGLWLTDASHRLRHGISRFFTYRDISTLTWVYDWKETVLVGQVATRAAHRGSGYARDFLRWTASCLAQSGKQAVLYALDVRVSFYQELGFQELASEYVLERKDVPKDRQEKGAL